MMMTHRIIPTRPVRLFCIVNFNLMRGALPKTHLGQMPVCGGLVSAFFLTIFPEFFDARTIGERETRSS